MAIDFKSDEFKELKDKLIIEFNQYLKESDLEKYHNVIKVFLEFLKKDNNFFKRLYDSTFEKMGSIDGLISGEYQKLQNNLINLKDIDFHDKNNIETKQNIIHGFVIILYGCFYVSWYSDNKNQIDRNFYNNTIVSINKELLVFDSDVLHMLLGISRTISKEQYDNYILNNQKLVEFMNDVKAVTAKVEDIQKKCEIYKRDIEKIENSLKEQRQEFNFIGLSKAFQDMKISKDVQLFLSYFWSFILMLIIVGILLIKIYWLFHVDLAKIKLEIVVMITVSSIFLIAVLIYFFRISLMNIKSIKSQILQLDLRLSLCQFIHNYADDSEKMRKDNMKDSLDRFESIIFSPIVANEEQIPATFDNLDQFIKVMNLVNGAKSGNNQTNDNKQKIG